MSLNLNHSEIQDQGLKYFVDVLRNDKVFTYSFCHYYIYITSFYLDYNQITNRGAEHIADLLSTNKVTTNLFYIVIILMISLLVDNQNTKPSIK